MAANTVQVKFGGDTTDLDAALKAARDRLAAFGESAAGAAKPPDAAFADLNQTLKGLNATLAQAAAATRDATSMQLASAAAAQQSSDNWKALAIAVAGAAAAYYGVKALAGAAVELTQATISTARAMAQASEAVGNFAGGVEISAIQGIGNMLATASGRAVAFAVNAAGMSQALLTAAASTDKLTGSISNSIFTMDRWFRSAQIYNSGLLQMEGASIAASGGMDKFTDAAKQGGFENVSGVLRTFTDQLAEIPGISNESAASIQTMLSAIPNYSTRANGILVSLIQTLSKTGDEAVANAEKITGAFNDSANGPQFLGDLTSKLKNLEDVKTLAAQIMSSFGDSEQSSKFLDVLISKLQNAGGERTRLLREELATYARFGPLGNLLVLGIRDQVAEAQKFNAELQKTLASLGEQKKAVDAIAAAQQAETTFQETLEKANPLDAQIDALNDKIRILTNGLEGATTDAADLIRRFEGFSAPAYKDSDGKYRAGFGSDTVTGADGSVAQVTAQTIVTREDAERDLARRIVEFQAEAASRIGPEWEKLSDRAKASLTSVFYNYGAPRVPESVIAAARTGNDVNIAAAVGGQSANPTRRAQEAANVAGEERSAEDAEKADQAIAALNDQLRRLNEQKAGGTAIDLEQLGVAERNLSAAKDAIADAKALADERRKAVEGAKEGTPEAQTQARRALVAAEAELQARETEQARSAAQLQAAAYEAGGRRRMQILNAELSQEQAAYAQGSAKWNELEQQKQQNVRAYSQQEKAEAETLEDGKYQDVLRGLTDRAALIRQEATERQISALEERALLAANLQEQLALQRAHQQTIQSIWGEGTAQFLAAQQQQERDLTTAQAQRIRNERETQRQILNEYRSSYEQIGSTVTSALLGVAEGQQSLRVAARSVALSLIETFVQARVKMVADWAAGVATQTALTATGETAKTAAVAAGTAARTGVEASGSAAASAMTFATITKSIFASAAETFAGIFGFLSPIMGPLAAGPAAAGEATVAAVAGSFAVGSWSLPGDMIAQVHQGEMIVPAAQTPWAQSLMANAAAGGGQAGGQVTVEHHTHFNVSAMDGQSVRAFLRDNRKSIVRTVNDGVRMGAHLGLSKLGGA